MIRQVLLYTKEKGTYVGPPKTGQPRAICLSPETIAVLKEYRHENQRSRGGVLLLFIFRVEEIKLR